MLAELAQKFLVLVTFWNAVMGLHILACFLVYQYRLRKTPQLQPLLFLVGGVIAAALVTPSTNAIVCWIALCASCYLAGWGGVVATRGLLRALEEKRKNGSL